MRKYVYIMAATTLIMSGCSKREIIPSVLVASPAEIVELAQEQVEEEEERYYFEPFEVYGAKIEIGKQVTKETIEMIYDFYVSKETYYEDVNRMLYTYEDYIENFDQYQQEVENGEEKLYEYSWFVLMGGQKQTGEYVGFSIYNVEDEPIPASTGILSNLYVMLDKYSNISYQGLKYGSTVEDMINVLGDYDGFFDKSDDTDSIYDEEYHYNYNDGRTYLTMLFKEDKLVAMQAFDVTDTRKVIDKYDEGVEGE